MTPVFTGSGGEECHKINSFKISPVEAKQSLFEIENILPVYIWVRNTAYKYVLRMRVLVIITKQLTLGFTKPI